MQRKITVSVIMPAYNAHRYIETAVRSVMAQSFDGWELLVIDDASTDQTAAIVTKLAQEDSRIRLITCQTNAGTAAARNIGIAECTGQYIAFLDSDDVWHPEKLKKQLDLAQKTHADLLYCSYGIIDCDGKKAKQDCIVPETVDIHSLLKENIIGCSTVMLRTEALAGHCFDPTFYHEDFTLWLRLMRNGATVAGCKETLMQWRYTKNSRSYNKMNCAKYRWQIYRRLMKLPIGKSIYYFAAYTVAGIKKYLR